VRDEPDYDDYDSVAAWVDAHFPDWYVEAKLHSIKARANDQFSLADLQQRYGWKID